MASRNAIHPRDVITLSQKGFLQLETVGDSGKLLSSGVGKFSLHLDSLLRSLRLPGHSALACCVTPPQWKQSQLLIHAPLSTRHLFKVRESLQCHWHKLPEPKQCLQKHFSKLECHIPLNRSGVNKKIPLQFYSCIAIFSWRKMCIHGPTKSICMLPTFNTHDNFKCM